MPIVNLKRPRGRVRCLWPGILVLFLAACTPFGVVNFLSPSAHYDRSVDVAYASLDRQVLDVYTPRASVGSSPVVVFFYGGGWRKGEKRNYQFVASSLTKAGYTVIIPDYRVFPEVVFPAFVEDGALAVSWAIENAGQYGGDPNTVFLMGHSAGAHIAALLATDRRYLAAHDIDSERIRGLVGLSGPYDFLPIESGYLLDVFPADRRAASQPVNFVTASSPPALLIHGDDDDVVDVANSESLATRLRQHGVAVTLKIYAGAGHPRIAAALAPPLDFTGDTLEDSREFLDKLSAKSEQVPGANRTSSAIR